MNANLEETGTGIELELLLCKLYAINYIVTEN